MFLQLVGFFVGFLVGLFVRFIIFDCLLPIILVGRGVGINGEFTTVGFLVGAIVAVASSQLGPAAQNELEELMG